MINITNNDTGIVFEFKDYTNTYPYNTLGYSILDSTITIFGQEVVCTCLYNEISIDGVQMTSIDDFKNSWKGNKENSSSSITISQSFDEFYDSEELGTTSPLGCTIYDKDGNAVLITKETKYKDYSTLIGFNNTYKLNIVLEPNIGIYTLSYVDKTYETNQSIETETTYSSSGGHFIKFTDITIQPQYTNSTGEWIGLSPKGNIMKVLINNSKITVSKYSPTTTWTVPKNIGSVSYTTFSSSQIVSVGDFIKFNDCIIQLTSSYTYNSRVFYIGKNNDFTIIYDTKLRYLYVMLTTINTTIPTDLLASTTLDGILSRADGWCTILPKTINNTFGVPKAILENTCNTGLFAGGVYKDSNDVRWVAYYDTLYTAEVKSTSMDFTNPSVVSWSTFVNNGTNLMPFNGLVLLDKNDLSTEVEEIDSGSTTKKKYRVLYDGNIIFYINATYNTTFDSQSNVTISLTE